MKDPLPIFHIARAASLFYGVSVEDLKSPSRKSKLVRPRHVAMYVARKASDASLPAIGGYFNRDHTTAKYAIDAIESAGLPSVMLECQKVYNNALRLYGDDMTTTVEAAISGGINFFEAKGNTQ